MRTIHAPTTRTLEIEPLERRVVLATTGPADAGEEPPADPVAEVCSTEATVGHAGFRPQRVTPQPILQGPLPAHVVGPAGEEISPDEHGRIKVQFHWERGGQTDDHSSCWTRVVQVDVSGEGQGMMLPRVGWEVLVDFLHGDPDRPLISGRVYNGATAAFGLPSGDVVSGLKSQSTPGGGGTNELVLDDTSGSERVRIHAQYDQDTTIDHDADPSPVGNRARNVTNNETILIGVDRTETVGGTQTETIGANQTINVDAASTEGVGGAMQLRPSAETPDPRLADAVWAESQSRNGDMVLKGSKILEN